MTTDKDLGLFREHSGIALVDIGEHNHFHGSHQILQLQKCHHPIIFRILNRFSCNHPADNHQFPVPNPALVGFLVQLEIRSHRRNIFPPALLVFLQGMSADVDAQNLLFKGQNKLFFVLLHLRKLNLEMLLFLFVHQFKKAHLPGHGGLAALSYAVHNAPVGHHILLAVSSQAVQCSCLNQIFQGLFVDLLSGHPLYEVRKALEGSPEIPLRHYTLHHGPSYALDGRQSIADRLV